MVLSHRHAVMPEVVHTLLERYPLVSDQVDKKELAVILSELARVLASCSGQLSVVEFGCYVGTTSLFVRRLLDELDPAVSFHVYDSFAGLPAKTDQDLSPAGEQFRKGELSVSRKDFERQFKKAGLRLPIIHKAWFSELTDTDVPTGICFAYLDGDYYESIRDSFKLLEGRLIPGATIVVDDYVNEALPGAARAVNEWLHTHAATIQVQSSLAILRFV